MTLYSYNYKWYCKNIAVQKRYFLVFFEFCILKEALFMKFINLLQKNTWILTLWNYFISHVTCWNICMVLVSYVSPIYVVYKDAESVNKIPKKLCIYIDIRSIKQNTNFTSSLRWINGIFSRISHIKRFHVRDLSNNDVIGWNSTDLYSPT